MLDLFDAPALPGLITRHDLISPAEERMLIDRIDATGELLHPYAAQPISCGWLILLYAPFTDTFSALPEQDFVRLKPATRRDLETRNETLQQGPRPRGA